MNKIYKLIWSQTANAFVAVSELATARDKSSSTTNNAALGAWVAVSEITKSKGKKSNKAIKSGVLVSSLVLFAGNAIAAPYAAGGGTATGIDAIAIGERSKALGILSMALGADSVAQGDISAAIGTGAEALGDESFAVGLKAKAIAKYSTALGNQSTAEKEFDLAVGHTAIASGGQSTAVGFISKSTGFASNAIGGESLAAGDFSTAVGHGAHATADSTLAAGQGAIASGEQSTAVGLDSKSTGFASNAIGGYSEAAGDFSTAVGSGARAEKTSDLAAGQGAFASGGQSTAVGFNSTSTGFASNAIGNSSLAKGNFSTAVGSEAHAEKEFDLAAGHNAIASGGQSTAVGFNSKSTGFASNAIGNSSLAEGNFSTAVGSEAHAEKEFDLAAGHNAIASGGQSTAVGFNSKSTGFASNAIGNSSLAEGDFSTAVGSEAHAEKEFDLAAGHNAIASGGQSTAVGFNSESTGLASNAIGNSSLAEGGFSTAVGSEAHAEKEFNLAAGYNAIASGDQSTAVGFNSKSTGFASNAIGNSSLAEGDHSIALGSSAKASAADTVALGTGSIASGNSAIAMGVNASASQRNALAMGSSASSATEDSVAIGKDVKVLDTGAPQTDQEGSVAIGSRTEVSGKASVGIGRNVRATARNAVAIGDSALATNTQAVAIARDAQASGAGAVAMGSASRSTSSHTTALGVGANASVSRSVALGSDAVADRIGFNIAMSPVTTDANATFAANQVYANAGATQAAKNAVIATVRNTTTNTYGAVSVGNAGVTRQIINLAPGSEDSDAVNVAQLKAATTHYYSVNDNGVQRANYNNDGATGINSLAAGTAASATESAATAVGNQATAAARNSVALGNQATANTAWSVAIGNKADATGSSAVAIGNGATTTVGDSVALGAGSKADANGRAVTEATVNGLTFGDFAGSVTHPGKVVSVGAKGEERQIKNVAPGQISNTSTDAINGSQLYATNAKLGNVAKTVVENFGGNATLNPDGSITYTNIGNTGKDNIHDAIQAATTKVEGDKGVSVTPTTNADGSKTYTVAAKTDNTTVKVDDKGNIAAVTAPLTTNTDGKVNTPAAPNALATAGDIANAINNSGWKLAADGTTGTELINPSDTVTFKTGSSNLTVKRDGANITYDLAKDININSVKFGANGPTIKADASNNINIAKSDGSATKITNVEAGTGDNDAVNVSQLKAAQAAATTKVAGDKGVSVTPTTNADGSKTYTVAAKTDNTTVKVDDNGNIAAVTAPLTTNTDGKVNTPAAPNALATAGDIANAINNSGWKLAADGTTGTELINPSDTVTFKTGSSNLTVKRDGANITYDLAKDININSVKFGDNGPTIKADASNNINIAKSDGSATKITNVEAGTGDKDAVNVSQLKAAQAAATTKVEAGDNMEVTSSTNADGSKTYTVATKKDVNFDSVTVGPVVINKDGINAGDKKITNVAPGEISATSKDAMNGSQLYNVQKAAVAAKTEVKAGDNVEVKKGSGDNGQDIYTVSAKDTSASVTAGSDAITVNKADPKKVGTVDVTDYKVDLSQATKDNIQKGVDAKDIVDNKGLTFAGDNNSSTEVQKLGSTVNVNGDSNITTQASGNTVKVTLNPNVTVESLTATNSVNVGSGGAQVALTTNVGKDGVRELSVGSANAPTRITNVAPGVDATDAVNVSQLQGLAHHINNRIDDVADDANAGVSSAMAMAALPQAYIPGKSMLTGGIASYNGEGAVAVGFSKLSDNGRWVLKVSGSADTQGNAGGAVGAGFHF